MYYYLFNIRGNILKSKVQGRDSDFSSSSYLDLLRKHLSTHHELSSSDINSFLENELSIPISCFNDKLSILESVVKYLKENLDYNYHKIGVLLERNERNIWTTYGNSLKKMKGKLDLSSDVRIPVSIFKTEAALLAIVRHMKENFDYNYHKIGTLLHRNERTIWVTYNKKKK
jgi:hypothetical protein